MMTERQFIESQKECASMLGMSLGEYLDYCKNIKITPRNDIESIQEEQGNTEEILKYLGISKEMLKIRKNCNMSKKAKMGEIWLVAMPILFVKGENNFDTGFQIRPFLIVGEGKGMLVLENNDYLALKITTKKNKVKNVEEIRNWKEIGLKEKSYIRIEIPQRIEGEQLIEKVSELSQEQFVDYYKNMLKIFNLDIISEVLDMEREEVANK